MQWPRIDERGNVPAILSRHNSAEEISLSLASASSGGLGRELIHTLVVTLTGITYWHLATIVLGAEPWDSDGYVGFYLGALVLCAGFGWVYAERSWRWGIILIFAQLPVMVVHVVPDGLVLVGLAYLSVQTLPAITVALAASHVRRSH